MFGILRLDRSIVDLIITTTASLQTQVQHALRSFKINTARDINEIHSDRKLVDCNQGNNLACGPNEEVRRPWLAALARLGTS